MLHVHHWFVQDSPRNIRSYPFPFSCRENFRRICWWIEYKPASWHEMKPPICLFDVQIHITCLKGLQAESLCNLFWASAVEARTHFTRCTFSFWQKNNSSTLICIIKVWFKAFISLFINTCIYLHCPKFIWTSAKLITNANFWLKPSAHCLCSLRMLDVSRDTTAASLHRLYFRAF